MYVYLCIHVSWVQLPTEEVSGSSEAGGTVVWEPPSMGARNQTLEKLQALLTTQPYHQPQILIFKGSYFGLYFVFWVSVFTLFY